MNGHIILSTEDGIHIVDNMESVYIDWDIDELVLAGGGSLYHIPVRDPERLLETIKRAFKTGEAAFIEVTRDD